MIPALKPVAVAVAAVMLAFGLTVGLVTPQPAAHADEKAMKAEKKTDPKAPANPAAKGRTITGTVLDADGKPVAAELRLVWIEAKPTPLGKANVDGTFKVTVPMTRGEYGGWLVATAPGHGPDFLDHGFDYRKASMTPTAEVTLKLPKERPIKGRIIDQNGKPVAGATVTATTVASFDSDASRDEHFKAWATQNYNHGVPPGGDRNMYFPGERSDLRPDASPSPYTAKSDADGRYTLTGIGANQLVHLRIRGAGVADKEIVVLNRDGFDPAPVNKLAKDNEFKGYSFGGKWFLYGADPSVVLDQEKVIRGRVTDHEGKPRVGVTVAFTRPNKRDLTHEWNQAVTDKDGRYEIRGARKHKGYMVEVSPDPVAGLLQCQGFADDTVGYEPITIDIKQARGVVVSGRVTNKATGKPVPSNVHAEVMANNPFADQYPPFLHSASSANRTRETDKDGRYRVVVIPGRVVLSAAPRKGDGERYKPAAPDPKHAASFHPSEGALMFDSYGGGRGFVQGNSCLVLDAKAGDTELTVDIELEPATTTLVKVVDADGKPVAGVKATGVEIQEFAHPTEFSGDTLTVYSLEAKSDRLVAVIHEKRKLVGTAVVTADDKNPVVTLGAAGTLTGRAVDKDGKPIAGLTVHFGYDRREVTEAHKALTHGDLPTTDANGEFRVEGVFPGQPFQFTFYRNRTRYGPEYQKAPKHTIAKPGDTLKLGDIELESTKPDGE